MTCDDVNDRSSSAQKMQHVIHSRITFYMGDRCFTIDHRGAHIYPAPTKINLEEEFDRNATDKTRSPQIPQQGDPESSA